MLELLLENITVVGLSVITLISIAAAIIRPLRKGDVVGALTVAKDNAEKAAVAMIVAIEKIDMPEVIRERLKSEIKGLATYAGVEDETLAPLVAKATETDAGNPASALKDYLSGK